MFITLDDRQYELAKTLRVAYKVQGQHSHKPYSEIFSSLGDMTLEQQVAIVYASFSVANPEEIKTISEKAFLDNFLDRYNVGELMALLEGIIEGIMGPDLIAKAKANAETKKEEKDEEGN